MMSLTLYLCRKNTFPGQMRCIFFSVSPRDREFPKTGHKMLAKWGIRLPNQFLSHNTLLQSKNQAKVAYFTKLMILIFGCPEEIRITNFTRMPLRLEPLSSGEETFTCIETFFFLHLSFLYDYWINKGVNRGIVAALTFEYTAL